MGRRIRAGNRQRGAVAVVTGLLLFVLMAFLGLVVDMGRLQVLKTELQNAADAAALAGGRELNGTRAGVTAAIAAATATAARNGFSFGRPVEIGSANLWIGNCPADACLVSAASIASDAAAVGMSFLKVHTGPRSMRTLFMTVFAAETVSTFGMAVAGRYTAHVAPIGVCAISPVKTVGDPVTGELLEFGFRRGIAYNIFELNPLGGAPGVPIWINPVDAPPGPCHGSNSGGAALAPFVCSGRSALSFNGFPAHVYANTGLNAGLMQRALNSRFEDPPAGNPSSPCDMANAPPDRNVKEYLNRQDIPGATAPRPPAQAGHPPDWMEPGRHVLPSQQTISISPATRKPVAAPSFAQYGALWSYGPAARATTDFPPQPGAAFTPGDWALLYGGAADTLIGGYPASSTQDSPEFPPGSGTRVATPYAQGEGSKYFARPVHAGVANRRVLNIALIECNSFSRGAPRLSCEPMVVLGVGRFFMPRKADLTGSGNRLDGEFAGLVDPWPAADIRLYR